MFWTTMDFYATIINIDIRCCKNPFYRQKNETEYWIERIEFTMKMQVLYFSKDGKGNAEALATAVGRTFKCKCDQIPPAYPCEGQKLVIIVYDNYAKPAKQLIDFCKDLKPERASNVAVITMSKTGSQGVAELEEIFKANKVEVSGKLELKVSKGLFGYGKLTDEDIKKANDFSTNIVKGLFEHLD